MSGARLVRPVALGAMTLVTVASLWAWAEPRTAPAGDRPSRAYAARRVEAPREPPHPGQASAGEGGGAGERDETPAPMNWTQFGGETPPYLAMLINFGILVGAYYLLGKKPIADALQGRRDTIAKEIDEAQQIKHEAEARAKHYQHKLDALEVDARAAREALVRAGEAERERIIREAEAKADRMQRDTQFLVEQEMKEIRRQLWRDAVDAAVTAAGELLRQRVTPLDQERLAEEYLAELGRAPRGGPEAVRVEGAPATGDRPVEQAS